MVEQLKKVSAVGILIVLSFLIIVLMLKQFVMDEELANCKDKIAFLEKDMQSILSPPYDYEEEDHATR